MSLGSRVSKLESLAVLGRLGRCPTCSSWPAFRVVYIDPPDEKPPPSCPARCPSCGFAPTTIAVEYVECWLPAGHSTTSDTPGWLSE